MRKDQVLIRAKKRHAFACVQANRIGEALVLFEQLRELDPRDAESWFMAGTLYGRLGRMVEAETALRQAVNLQPGAAQAYLNLGQALEGQAKFAEAEDCYRHALSLKADAAEAYEALGRLEQLRGDPGAAPAHYQQAIQLNPARLSTYLSLAQVLRSLGDLDGAAAALAPLLERDPVPAEAAYALAGVRLAQGRDAEALTLLEALLARTDLTAEHRAWVHLRLGELHDRRGEFVQAFTQIETGRRLATAHFAAAEWQARINATMRTFNHDALRRAPRAGNCSERPVFIVGMPYAGAARVEQILALHPEAATAGELPQLERLALAMHQALAHATPRDDITQLSREQCDGWAQSYLEPLEGRFPRSRRVIDALPQNFQHLGLIALLFPMARVIHCVRDPLDTCLASYFYESGAAHPYVRSLADLGAYYRQYQALMVHWAAVLDLPILELRYEALLQDPHKTIRAMVEFCGLKWDKRCLEPCQGRQSAAARRRGQLEYGAAVGWWRHYAAYLAPLAQALAGEPPS